MAGTSTISRRRTRSALRHHLLALPAGIWTLFFFLAPLLLLTVYSFGQIDIFTFQVSFGWTGENYSRLVNGLYVQAILRSLAMTVGATIACAVIGFPVALTISRQRGARQNLLLIAVLVPFWISFVVRTYAWINLLSAEGLVTRAVRFVGLVGASDDLLYTRTAISIVLVYSYLPLMILPIFVALERIDGSLLQAAEDLGAARRNVLRRIILPLSAPGVIAGCIMVGIPATGEYVIPAIMGGDKTLMIGNIVASQFLTVGDYPFGSALAVSLMALMCAVLVATRKRLASAEEIV